MSKTIQVRAYDDMSPQSLAIIRRSDSKIAAPYTHAEMDRRELLRVLDECLDALRYVRVNIGSIPPHKILQRVERPLSQFDRC